MHPSQEPRKSCLVVSSSAVQHALQPRIDDIRDGGVGVSVPITASLPDSVRDDSLQNLVRSFHHVDVQPSRHVPCDVAMERPHPWVVGDILNHHVTRLAARSALNQLHITSLSVGLMNNGAVPGADTFGQHVEIVTVQMHRMRGLAVVDHHHPNAGVGAKVVHVPLRIEGIRRVTLVGEQEDWIVHVSAEADAVHAPQNIAGLVRGDGDGDLLRGGRCRSGGEGEERYGLIERVVAAVAVIEWRGSRRRGQGGIGAIVVYGAQPETLGAIRAGADERPHENCRSGGQFGFDDHVGTLPNSQGHHVGGIRFDGNEIVGHDRHRVVIDRESHDGLR